MTSGSAASYPVTDLNTPSRHSERARYDVESVHSILDEGMIAHVGFVADGRPQVLPMLYVRVGTSLFLHGSTGAHFARKSARGRGLGVAVEVTLVDSLVLARSTFSHSVNYRSVVAHGEAVVVTDPDRKYEILGHLVERLVPGRSADARPPAPDELRKTAVLELALADVAAKVRTGDPLDDDHDLGSACWAGQWPFVTTMGVPVRAADLQAGVDTPPYLVPGEPITLPL